MARTLLILCIAAAGLAAKDRAWQTGQLLDNKVNPYFRTAAASSDTGGLSSSASTSFGPADNGALVIQPHNSDGNMAYENYVIASGDQVYMVEYAHFKNFPSANLSAGKPVTFAVEKNKLIIRDLDRREFETTILKQADKHGSALASVGEPVKPEAAPAKTRQAKVDQPKPDKPKPQSSKPDNLFATAALTNDDINPPKPKPPPKPAPQPQAVQTPPAKLPAQPQVAQTPPAKPPAKVEASVTKPVQKPQPEAPKAAVPTAKPAPKPTPKAEAAVTKPPQRPQPEGPVVRASTKDRAWQSGQLLSVANNKFFFNVTYTSDTEGSAWPFSQGSDGRYTVTGQIAAETNSPYTYDNYVIESQFVAYLVQRMRPKTSPPVRLPGTQPLKFAVDKGKMWVLDEQGIEYETKVIKLIQKDAIVDPLARASAR